MNTLIDLTIPKSTSANLPRLLGIAKTFTGFEEPTQSRPTYRIAVEPEELCQRHRDLGQLFEGARGWKGTQLRINGRIADTEDLRGTLTVFQCADKRSSAVIPESYCQSTHDHGWGCKHLTAVSAGVPHRDFEARSDFRYWYQFGSFSEDRSQWVIDKARLLAAIKREASAQHLDVCPFFPGTMVEARIDALPNTIEFGEESAWEILFDEKCDGSTIQRVPIGVQPRRLEHDLRDADLSRQSAKPSADPERIRTIPQVSFDDIGGVDEIVGLIREVIELPLRHPALIKHLGIAPHKGILLYGPPGCGKTLIAKAIANEIQAHFVSIGGPELFTKWFGESEANLRAVFEEARTFAPSVIFFDEIDSIAQKRSGGESLRHESVFVNQLLTLMDGIELYENVCVIASTNRPELLDDAIMRPGRFDYTLEVKHPSADGCRKIFGIHTRNMPLSRDVNTELIAGQLHGLTGAEIAFVAREGAYNCLRRRGEISELVAKSESDVTLGDYVVEQEDFENALKSLGGPGGGGGPPPVA